MGDGKGFVLYVANGLVVSCAAQFQFLARFLSSFFGMDSIHGVRNAVKQIVLHVDVHWRRALDGRL